MNQVWEICMSEEYFEWFKNQSEDVKEAVAVKVKLLEELGPNLRRPHVGKIEGSTISSMKELVVQVNGYAYRVFFCFGKKRQALLLNGGCKDGIGEKRFYAQMIPLADKIAKDNNWN